MSKRKLHEISERFKKAIKGNRGSYILAVSDGAFVASDAEDAPNLLTMYSPKGERDFADTAFLLPTLYQRMIKDMKMEEERVWFTTSVLVGIIGMAAKEMPEEEVASALVSVTKVFNELSDDEDKEETDECMGNQTGNPKLC